MIVKCVETTKNKLPHWNPNSVQGTKQTYEFCDLELGKQYLVCGVLLLDHGPDYLLQDRDRPDYPIVAPTSFFEIFTSSKPLSWFAGHIRTRFGDTPAMGYLEWVSNSNHFDGLTDYQTDDIEIFEHRANEFWSQLEA
jgi:hypothetical protein